MANSAAAQSEAARWAMPLAGREAGEAGCASRGGFAMAGVFFAGSGSSLPAVTSGQTIRTKGTLGAFNLTLGTLPSSRATT